MASNHVSYGPETDTTVIAAMHSQLVLSERLEKDVLEQGTGVLTGKHSATASLFD